MISPKISQRAFIAKDAVILGDVTIARDSSVWFHATIRAEAEPITIAEESNVQDGCVLHVDPGFPMKIGKRVTVGHGAILHGCEIGDESLIGMGATVLNGAKIGRGCTIGAGSLVTQKPVMPAGSLAFGNPCRVVRPADEALQRSIAHGAEIYVMESREYAQQGLFVSGDCAEI